MLFRAIWALFLSILVQNGMQKNKNIVDQILGGLLRPPPPHKSTTVYLLLVLYKIFIYIWNLFRAIWALFLSILVQNGMQKNKNIVDQILGGLLRPPPPHKSTTVYLLLVLYKIFIYIWNLCFFLLTSKLLKISLETHVWLIIYHLILYIQHYN